MEKRLRLNPLFAILAALLLLAGLSLIGPIAQDPGYHQFIDQRTFAGIPNAWNVLSNLAFIATGFYGLVTLQSIHLKQPLFQLSRIFFTGLILTGLGSGYYHLSPSNETLIWDRIPMTISFMAFFSFIISVHLNEKIGYRLLGLLLPLGILSVVYWGYTETIGRGDLRLYALVQFLPMILIPAIIWLNPQRSYNTSSIWIMLMLYVFSKLAEHFDGPIFSLLGISGHTVKHVIAALTGIVFISLLSSFQPKPR